uniref:Uncharacterized protein n=1 Tax=Panagrolaimus sp. ES5 TaxID=591445 RepID=A0AC34FBY7_9BILA
MNVFSYEEILIVNENRDEEKIAKIEEIVEPKFRNDGIISNVLKKIRAEIMAKIDLNMESQKEKNCAIIASSGEMYLYKYEHNKMVPYSVDGQKLMVAKYIEEFGVPEICKKEKYILVFRRGCKNNGTRKYILDLESNKVNMLHQN